MSDEQRIAALREEIRRAGRTTQKSHWITAGVISVPVAALGLLWVGAAGLFAPVGRSVFSQAGAIFWFTR